MAASDLAGIDLERGDECRADPRRIERLMPSLRNERADSKEFFETPWAAISIGIVQ